MRTSSSRSSSRPTTGGFRRGGPAGPGGPGNRQTVRKKRSCRFCGNKEDYVDYKNEKKLSRFVSEQGRIIPKRITGTCSRHQRMLVKAIKKARHLALLPYVADAVK
jgi:small subunit ribosomal protein S18